MSTFGPGTLATIHHGTREVVVLSTRRWVAGGALVTVAWTQDNETQRLSDGTIHPMHRAGFSWEEPVENLRAVTP